MNCKAIKLDQNCTSVEQTNAWMRCILESINASSVLPELKTLHTKVTELTDEWKIENQQQQDTDNRVQIFIFCIAGLSLAQCVILLALLFGKLYGAIAKCQKRRKRMKRNNSNTTTCSKLDAASEPRVPVRPQKTLTVPTSRFSLRNRIERPFHRRSALIAFLATPPRSRAPAVPPSPKP